MNNEGKERRCLNCHKLLTKEKVPICKRCILEGRNKVGAVVGGGLVIGGVAVGSSKTSKNK